MELTDGAVCLSQIPSCAGNTGDLRLEVKGKSHTLISRSRISQLKMLGFSRLYSSIRFSTSGVATRGLLPPMTPGRMLPVSE